MIRSSRLLLWGVKAHPLAPCLLLLVILTLQVLQEPHTAP